MTSSAQSPTAKMPRPSWTRVMFALLVSAALPAFAQIAPDLTTANWATLGTNLTYNLGPTGMRGWIYVARDSRIGPDGRGYSRGVDESMTDCQPYQVLVTAIGTGTPAAGVMQLNDVLLGVSTGSNNVPVPLFTNDTRRAIGAAIGAAEAGDGWMNFKIWRAGVTNEVSIRLALRGLAYSASAPYNCPKSAVILSNAVNVLAQRPLNYSLIGNQIVGLAMLASGNTNFASTLQTYARAIRAPNQGDWFWDIGYSGVFLAEYYLKTGDTNVLPRLASLALYCANGQDRYGTMCHGPGFNNADGSPNGTAGGYGPVNAVGVTANLAIVMAQKCLLAAGRPVDPAIPAAITRGTNFFGWYVQKGEIQYGEHLPWGAGGHASNGKHGGAALLFAMTGNRPVETEYWTRMTLAGYLGREYGHTGQGLSYLWESLGANVAGTNALAAYLAKIHWHLDLQRRSDGSFGYDGAEQYGPSDISDYWAVGGNNTYAGEDPTAYYVLTYALPLQQILLTGKNADPTNFLTPAQITNAIWSATIPTAVSQMTTNQLIAALSEFDPNVRCWSALELANRTNVSVTTLTNLAASTNAWIRAAACVALGQKQSTNGFPALVQCLSDTDISVRAHAAIALKKCGAAITNYIPAMLTAYLNNATDPNVINWKDPWQGANETLGSVLWGGWLLTSGVGNDNLVPHTVNANRSLLYPALTAGLKHPDSLSRGDAASFINQRLSLADIQALSPSLIECATTPVLADPMWRSDGRSHSIQALAKHFNAEAVTLALAMQNQPWVALGQGDAPEDDSPSTALNSLKTFGDSVRWTLPTLNNYLTTWGPSSGRYSSLVSAITTIAAATTAPTITNLYPVAISRVVATTNAVAITLTGTSWRTNTVSFQNVTAPANGTLSGTAPNLTYTPKPGFTGVDRFTFKVADSYTNSEAAATVSVIVGAAGAGVTGQYFDNADFTNQKFTRTDPQINFDWGTGSPSNSIAADTFSVRWSGVLLAPESGNYIFSSLNSDGVRFYLNGNLLINDWTDQTRNWTDGGSIYLNAGQQYSVQMDYYENTGDAAAKLKWSGPSFGGNNGVLVAKEWLFTGAGINNLPVFAYGQSATLLQNSNAVIALTASPNGTNFQIVTAPANGVLTGTPPLVTYTPNTNFSGADSFTFTASSATVTSAPATVTLSILAGTPTAFTWKNSVSSNWNFAANWTNAAAPAATGQPNYALNFIPTGSYSVTNDLNAGFAANQLNFAGNVTLEGNSVSLTTNGPIQPQFNQNSANNVVVNVPLGLAAPTTVGGIGGGQIYFKGLISGPGALILNSPGTVEFTLQTNAYSGGTIINAGRVNGPPASDKNTPYLGTGPITINNATLFFNRHMLTNAITLNGATLTGGNSFRTYFTGPVTVSNVTTVDLGTSGGFEISGNVSGPGGLTTVGTTTWNLSGTNTYTGATVIQAGTISYTKAVAVAPGSLAISNGATANLNYTGTRTNSGLVLGGTNMASGVYGSPTSSATNKDSHFVGSGTITVMLPPTASFIATPTNGYAPLRVVFTDTSTGSITNRQWNFGDGNTFTTPSQITVTNLYTYPGLYAVTLTAKGQTGAATNVQTGLISVTAVPMPGFSFPKPIEVNLAGVVSASFPSLTGLRYRLAFKNNLDPTNAVWTPVTPPPPDGWTNGNNATITISDTIAPGTTQRFYRLEAKSVSAP